MAKTTKKSNHILMQAVQNLPGTLEEKDEKNHAAMLLALYGAVTKVVQRQVIPTPLLGVKYDQTSRNLEVEHFEGQAGVPKTGQQAISTLDVILACHLRDIPLIFEGDTGVGKTLTTEGYFGALLPAESSIVMSLSQRSWGDSPKSQFETSDMVKGMPQVRLNQEAMRRIAAMYVDELNLGEPAELLQLSYGRVLLSRERGIAGIPIPKLTAQGVKYDEEDLKRLWLAGSQNPPQSRDNQFSGMELTASMKNRFLVLRYPGIIKSAGSTLWLVERENGLHHAFLKDFAARYTDLTKQTLEPADLSRDWLSVYAYIMDSKRTEKAILKSALEFADLLIWIMSGDPASAYKLDAEVAKAWKSTLPTAVQPAFAIADAISDTNEVQKVRELVGSFAKPLTERDDTGIHTLADLFAMMRNLKSTYRQSRSPEQLLDNYIQQDGFITVEDVATAATILARNKQAKLEKNPLDVVNAILAQYASTTDELAQALGLQENGQPVRFVAGDSRGGLKNMIYSNALREANSVGEIIARLGQYTAQLRSTAPVGVVPAQYPELRKMIITRTVADLATAAAFIIEYRQAVDESLASSQRNGNNPKQKIKKIYEQESGNPTFPVIYAHRLPRVL